MYIVLTNHIVNHFEVHYNYIDKLWDCLNVFLINQYYFKPNWGDQLRSSVGEFGRITKFYLKLTNVYGFSSVLKNFNTILNYLN